MRITKLGHSCVLVEEGDARLVIDPGRYSRLPDDPGNIDAIIVTHKHGDHCDLELIKKILAASPNARVMGNREVVDFLAGKGVQGEEIKDGPEVSVAGISIKARTDQHAPQHPLNPSPTLSNTGYLVGGKFFHTGDSLADPGFREVEVLALPVVGGWMKVAEAVDLALAIKPRACFPIHDGTLAPGITAGFYRVPSRILPQFNIEFIIPSKEPMEF